MRSGQPLPAFPRLTARAAGCAVRRGAIRRYARLAVALTLLAVLGIEGTGLAQTGKDATSKARAKLKDAEGDKPRRIAPGKKKSEIEGVGRYASRHFVVFTDLSADEAEDLLGRLETMLTLISKYWGKPMSGSVEMYVVKELRNWPAGALPPEGRASVESGGGLTVTHVMTAGSAFRAKSTVYAVADRGTPQHEAVHAYCGQTFGRTGPVWYSEGMAEMGQYWRASDSSVNAHPLVIEYLRNTEVKSLNEIVNGEEWSGDSWRNYAWRWALCHLLANNPNYSPRFRPLGLGLLTRQEVSFEQTYGDMAKEISFEYREFLRHLQPGLRVDLCGFDWKAKFKPVRTSAITTVKVDAGKGWQPSRLTVYENEDYEYSAEGTWTARGGQSTVSADGAEDGAGRLMGVILRDEDGEYALSEPFELGVYGTFTPPAQGNLFLRCRDEWVSLGDNRGALTIRLKLAAKGNLLPPPKDEP